MINTNFKIKNYKLVAIRINAAVGKFMFPDLPELRNVKTVAIEFYPLSVVSKSPEGVDSQPNYDNAFITLVSGNTEVVQNLDLLSLNNFSGDDTEVTSNGFNNVINGYEFNYEKSYISYATGTTAAYGGTATVLLFGVYYEKI